MREIFIADISRRFKWIHLLIIGLGCLVVYFIDVQADFTYWERAGVKILLFLVVPLIYVWFMPRMDLFSIFRQKERTGGL
ncbi:MAG: hypothetical protein EOM07_12345, partial [Clostridia bacterium]|nr:hypothetical protein [Clostridia bacterium]